MGQENDGKKVDDAMEKYQKIRECLTGLYEIININFREEDVYHQVAVDNLINLNNEILDLLRNSYTPREVRIRLREIEFDEKEAEKAFPL